MNVKGRDAKTGMPREITLQSSEIYEVLRRPARQIADEVHGGAGADQPGIGQRCVRERH